MPERSSRLLLVDCAVSILAITVANLVIPIVQPRRAIVCGVVFLAFQILFYVYTGLYRQVNGLRLRDQFLGLLSGTTVAFFVATLVQLATLGVADVARPLATAAGIAMVAQTLVRSVRGTVYASRRARGEGVRKVLVVGDGEMGRALLGNILGAEEIGYQALGFLSASPGVGDLGRIPCLGQISDLEGVLRDNPAVLVMVALPRQSQSALEEVIEVCDRRGASVSFAPSIVDEDPSLVQTSQIGRVPLLARHSASRMQPWQQVAKRWLDLFVTVVTAPLWLIPFGLVALAIRLEGKGPIFYSQKRAGEGGVPFPMMKFRSMVVDAEKLHAKLVADSGQDPRHPKFKHDPRVTRVGRFIRKTSLDELPQMINVLKGEMSLVGPRPPTLDEVEFYLPWHRKRLDCKPGITGLWQVRGRSEIPFDEMCLLDIYYIENWSLLTDIKLLLVTVPRVLLRRGAY